MALLLSFAIAVGVGLYSLASLRTVLVQERGAALARTPLENLQTNLEQKGKLQYGEAHGWLQLDRRGVVILTTSQDEQDVLKSYNLYANCYITKPVDVDQFITVVKSIEDFRLVVVELPKNGKGNAL